MNLIEGRFQSEIWMGLNSFCTKNNIDLVIFNGKLLKPFYKYDNQSNIIYEYVNNKIVDGLVIPSLLFLFGKNRQGVVQFIRKFKNLPVVSLGLPINGLLNVMIDQKAGMRSLCEHIIIHHSAKNILFISGQESHPDAVIRLNVLKKVLKENNMKMNPDLLGFGNFTSRSAEKIVQNVIDKNIKFDAIIAANDEMAIGAYTTLQNNNIKVPKDVIVTGFDDIDDMKYLVPPFTTVRQPLFEMGEKAGELLLKKINNEIISGNAVERAELVIRESCGCLLFSSKININNNIRINKNKETIECFLKEKNRIVPYMKSVLMSGEEINIDYDDLLNSFFDMFVKDISSESNADILVKYINDVFIHNIIIGSQNVYNWKQSLEIMKNFIYRNIDADSGVSSRIDEIFYKIDMMLLKFTQRAESYKNFVIDRNIWELSLILRSIRTASRYSELRNAVYNNLKILGIKTVYIFLYEKFFENYRQPDFKIPKKAQLFVKYEQVKEDHVEKGFIKTNELLPHEIFSAREKKTLLVFPLCSEIVHFGYVVYEMSNVENFIYESLTEQISSTLYNIYQLDMRRQAEDQLRDALVELKALNKELHNLSVRDELTGLYNRRGLLLIGEERFNNTKSNERFAILYGDLDDLKVINDSFGHTEGDFAIKTISDILRNTLKSADIEGRLGGDEFVVIIDNISDENDVGIIIEKIQKNIEAFNKASKKPYNLSITFGYSIFDKNKYIAFSQMLKEADKRLYSFKKKKKPDFTIIKTKKK
ncbi:MAG: GGDEF domain-containing protein [Spirochaetales bacterium]|nr:GGDEF domain-containing protein [Spirochaetales bacterium]